MNKLLIVIFVAIFCRFSESFKVKVSVYYETLCPDSRNFINNQFWPTYKKLGEYIDVDLVPYGKAYEIFDSGSWVFHCQHGPDECFGNKYHSCAIAIYSKEESAEFVYCSMNSANPSSILTLRECAANARLNWKNLQTCYDSGQADKLLINNGQRTKNIINYTNFIPTIILDDRFSTINQSEALRNFQRLICDALNQQPDICKEEIEVVFVAA